MKRTLIALCLLIPVLTGCTGTQVSRGVNLWASYDVTLYAAGGTPIGHWVTKDKVQSEDNSDGWYFTDANTGRLTIVQGTVVIKQL